MSSTRMFTQRFREWKVFKNIGSQDVVEYLQQTNRGTRTTRETTPSVTLRGRTVTKQRLSNHMRRTKIIPKVSSNEADTLSEDHFEFNDCTRTEASPLCLNKETEVVKGGPMDVSVDTQELANVITKDHDMPDVLTSEDLASLQIAMLQTDFHCQMGEGTCPTIRYKGKVRDPVISPSPSNSLSGPQELNDLEYVLYNCDRSYARFLPSKHSPASVPLELSSKQQSQAKDFYARHWLALNLLLEPRSEAMRVGFGLMNEVCEQVAPILMGNHPHFLTWFAFVVCYSDRTGGSKVQERTLKFTLEMSRRTIPQNDPRLLIQQCLAESQFRENICLAMLQCIISIFRQQLQASHLQALDLLARLFDHVEAQDDLDGDVVEETLQRWAQSSLSLAAVIKEDQQLAREFANGELSS